MNKIRKELHRAFSVYDKWKSNFGESPYNKIDLIDYESRKRHFHNLVNKKVDKILKGGLVL